ncbi:MAG: peptidase [Steroidobacteraceae bacterium]|jgi:Zn-dependent M28 family amino/carboxypeptidase|nr:peptidase [Steroidobacteraceae bacterium]
MESVKRIGLFVAVLVLLVGVLASCVAQPGVRAIASPDAAIDTAALERHVRMLSSTLHPRSFEHAQNLDAAADYVLGEFRATGASTDVQAYEVDGRTYRNVIARFGPATGPLLVIGAHYDSCSDTPGADDNASGVAGLIELARALAATPPTQPVELVAYTLEEPPFFRTESMGSFQHARGLSRQGREVRLMLSLEMIGFFRDTPRSQQYPLSALKVLYPDEGNFIALVGGYRDFGAMRRVKGLFKGASDLPATSINAPALVQGVDFSDHASYWRFGMPAIMVTDTAFLRNPNYHGAGDTADTLDYARMAKVVRGVHAVAMEF